MTGADDSIRPAQLAEFSERFPFVEWGILHSKTQIGGPRFPSWQWLDELTIINQNLDRPMDLSLHLCGSYVRQFVSGYDDQIMALECALTPMFGRIQLNFHAIPHGASTALIELIKKYSNHEFIFQYDGVNDSLMRKAADAGCNVSALFDQSGGAGILPVEWPRPLEGIKCGYAGGLSPLNLADQIKAILERAGDIETWLDIETHVRSNSDREFDLRKVRECLEIVEPFIKDNKWVR